MATYRTAPNLGKPPPPRMLTKRARRMSKQGAAAMRRAAAGRSWLKGRVPAPLEVTGGPHPLPVERIEVETLKGSAGSLARYADGLGLIVRVATNGRDVEVRIGRRVMEGARYPVVGRAVFRDGRLVHAFAYVDGSMRKRTLTALKAELAEAAA